MENNRDIILYFHILVILIVCVLQIPIIICWQKKHENNKDKVHLKSQYNISSFYRELKLYRKKVGS